MDICGKLSQRLIIYDYDAVDKYVDFTIFTHFFSTTKIFCYSLMKCLHKNFFYVKMILEVWRDFYGCGIFMEEFFDQH